MDYKKVWKQLEKKLVYADENAHPRFKSMGEKPTIPIFRVLRMMKELEVNQIKEINTYKSAHKKKPAIRPKLQSRLNGINNGMRKISIG